MHPTGAPRTFEFEHEGDKYRALGVILAVREGILTVVDIGTTLVWREEFAAWEGIAWEGSTEIEWLKAKIRTMAGRLTPYIEAEQHNSLSLTPRHSRDCALGGADLGSVNHCTCGGADIRRRGEA